MGLPNEIRRREDQPGLTAVILVPGWSASGDPLPEKLAGKPATHCQTWQC